MYRAPFIHIFTIFIFLANAFGPLPIARADDFRLPMPGVMVHLSPPLDPPILKGIKVHPDNPFRFDFILDKGDSFNLTQQQIKDESTKLIKYFLASLTIPEKDLWVNLSPYEKDRIIPQSFGLTEMGRDLLAEDYMLKQITASLIYPEDEIGKKFWKRIYQEAQKRYGTTNIPVNTFNKVWIVPEKAVVYENAKAGTAYVVESKLKVMLEQDYLSLEKHEGIQSEVSQSKGTSQLGNQIVREIVIPELTKEVNEDKNFARLRQVYNSLILATWYKKKIKDSILEQVYADKDKVLGVNISDPQEKERIYTQYLRAFKKGVFNYIKEDIDPLTQETIPRKYFSGGEAFTKMEMNAAMTIIPVQSASNIAELNSESQDLVDVQAGILSAKVVPNRAIKTVIKRIASSPRVWLARRKVRGILENIFTDNNMSGQEEVRVINSLARSNHPVAAARAIVKFSQGFWLKRGSETSSVIVVLSQSHDPEKTAAKTTKIFQSIYEETHSLGLLENLSKADIDAIALGIEKYGLIKFLRYFLSLFSPDETAYIVRSVLKENNPTAAAEALVLFCMEFIERGYGKKMDFKIVSNLLKFSDTVRLANSLSQENDNNIISNLLLAKDPVKAVENFKALRVVLVEAFGENIWNQEGRRYFAKRLLEILSQAPDAHAAAAALLNPDLIRSLEHLATDHNARPGVYSLLPVILPVAQSVNPQKVAGSLLILHNSRHYYLEERLEIFSTIALMPNAEEISALVKRYWELTYDTEEPVVSQGRMLLNMLQGPDAKRNLEEEIKKREAYADYNRSIQTVMREHPGYIFLHGFTLFHNPNIVGTQVKQATWDDKLKVFLAYSPTVASQTVGPNEPFSWQGMFGNTYWSPIGVILRSGRVRSAINSDAKSRQNGINGRETVSNITTRTIKEQIADAIRNPLQNRGRDAYNEFSIDDPQPAGLYICWEVLKTLPDHVINGLKELYVPISVGDSPGLEAYKESLKYKIPLYIIKDGTPYEAVYDEHTQSLSIGKEADILESTYEMPLEEREVIRKSLLIDPPFNDIPGANTEKSFLQFRHQGRAEYIYVTAFEGHKKNGRAMDQHLFSEIYSRFGGRKEGWNYQETPTELVAQINHPQRETTQYWLIGGILVAVDLLSREMDFMGNPADQNLAERRKTIRVNRDIKIEISNSVVDKISYLEGAKEVIQRIEALPYSEEIKQEARDAFAFQVYGFGEQAREMGDLDIARQAFDIASRLFPLERYEEIVHRRLTPEGRLIITEEDLFGKRANLAMKSSVQAAGEDRAMLEQVTLNDNRNISEKINQIDGMVSSGKAYRITVFHGKTSNVQNAVAEGFPETLGEGLYLTDKVSAENYADVRVKDLGGNPIVEKYELDSLKLLVLKNNRLPSEIEKAWRAKLLEINHDESIKMVVRGAAGYIFFDVPFGAHVTELQRALQKRFSQFLQSQGYEGLVAIEGGEGENRSDHVSVVIFDRESSKIKKFSPREGENKSGPGGIDLTPANMNLQTRNPGGAIRFHMDTAMLQRLQNAPGFVPVIINIKPMVDLQFFLGIKETKNNIS